MGQYTKIDNVDKTDTRMITNYVSHLSVLMYAYSLGKMDSSCFVFTRRTSLLKLIGILFFIGAYFWPGNGCPEPCKCDEHLHSIVCQKMLLTEVPTTESRHKDTRNFLLQSNQIKSIDDTAFTNLTSLRVLLLSRNMISVISPSAFATMPSLETLRLDHNRIRDILSIRHLPRLKLLALQGNYIHLIASHDFYQVSNKGTNPLALFLSYNFVFALSNLTLRVEEIEAVANRLNAFDLHNIAEPQVVRKINLNNNRIRFIPNLEGMVSLERLTIADNLITDISFEFPSSLKSLSIHGNLLDKLPASVFQDHMTFASLKNNNARFLMDIFDGQAFFPRKIDLSNNQIINETFNSILHGLQKLFLDNNLLKGEFVLNLTCFPHLTTLTLSGNGITSISVPNQNEMLHEFNDLPSTIITSLKVDENQIRDLTFLRSFPNLGFFHGNRNLLTIFNRSAIDQQAMWLNTIVMRRNKLATLDFFTNIPRLQYLDLSNNKIRTVNQLAFKGSPSLRTLRLSGNEITDFPSFTTPNTIANLMLANNLIRGGASGIHAKYPMLEFLNLSENRLENFSIGRDISRLKSVIIRKTGLLSLGNIARSLTAHLEIFDVSGNLIDDIDNVDWDNVTCNTLNLSQNLLASVPLLIKCIASKVPGACPCKTFLAKNNLITSLPPSFIGTFQTIDLSRNRLQYLHERHTQGDCCLKELDVSLNNIYHISSFLFQNCTGFFHFIVADNPLVDVSWMRYVHTQWLHTVDLSRTAIIIDEDFGEIPIMQLIMDDMKNIEMTAAVENAVKYVTFCAKFHTFISLRSNRLDKFPVLYSTRLKSIDLCHNRISELRREDLQNLRSLQVLNLSHNLIRSIAPFSFLSCPHLRDIDLSNNPVSFISTSAVDGLISDARVELGNSKIFELFFAPLPPIISHIWDESWSCVCRPPGMQDWFLRDLRCTPPPSPHFLHHRDLMFTFTNLSTHTLCSDLLEANQAIIKIALPTPIPSRGAQSASYVLRLEFILLGFSFPV